MSQAYPIKTLQDIFNLPTRGHMERCLKDIGESILHARDVLDTVKACAKADGIEVENNLYFDFKLQESIDWIDDGATDQNGVEVIFNNEVLHRSFKPSHD